MTMLEFEEAIRTLQQVLQQQPDNAAVWCSWGVALMELQRYGEAAEKFREAVQHQPEFAVAWYGWGR